MEDVGFPRISGVSIHAQAGVKVVQELMRDADSRTTLDIYSQSDDEDKRAAQKHISRLFVAEQAS
jgi:hypothetical protein